MVVGRDRGGGGRHHGSVGHEPGTPAPASARLRSGPHFGCWKPAVNDNLKRALENSFLNTRIVFLLSSLTIWYYKLMKHKRRYANIVENIPTDGSRVEYFTTVFFYYYYYFDLIKYRTLGLYGLCSVRSVRTRRRGKRERIEKKKNTTTTSRCETPAFFFYNFFYLED